MFLWRGFGWFLAFLVLIQLVSADRSWSEAYNAAWARVKADGTFLSLIEAAFPGLVASLRTLGDCPATPETFPFPARHQGTVLDDILQTGQVILAFQFDDPTFQDDSPIEPGESRKAFWQLSKAIVNELASAYDVDLEMITQAYPLSAQSVRAVIDGQADMTDMFNRQWTLLPDEEPKILRRTGAQPSCTLWLATLSTSWIVADPEPSKTSRIGENWTSLADLNQAGEDVIIPVYSTMQAFQNDIKVYLPQAVYLDRPEQNFESDPDDLTIVMEEFLAGEVTVLMAANSDITFAAANVGIDFSNYTLGEAQTPIDLPVGAFLRTNLNNEPFDVFGIVEESDDEAVVGKKSSP